MYKSRVKFASLFAMAAVLLAGCGGGGGGSSAPMEKPNVQPLTLTAKFVDSPVSGITVRSGPDGTFVSTTDENGAFQYQTGGAVEFSIGQMKLGAVTDTTTMTNSGLVTPLTLDGDTSSEASPRATNVLRILQSLDSDGNPENGITISAETAGAVTPVDFNLSVESFEMHPAVTAMLNSVAQAEGQPRALVAAEMARQHFTNSMSQLFTGMYDVWFNKQNDAQPSTNTLTLNDRNSVVMTGHDVKGWSIFSAAFDSQGNLTLSCLPQVAPAYRGDVTCMRLSITRFTGTTLIGKFVDLQTGTAGEWTAVARDAKFVSLMQPQIALQPQGADVTPSAGSLTWEFRNVSSQPMAPTSVSVTGNFTAPYVVEGTCKAGTAVAPGQVCTVVARFTSAPTCAQGTFLPTVVFAEGQAQGKQALIAYAMCNVVDET